MKNFKFRIRAFRALHFVLILSRTIIISLTPKVEMIR